MSCLGGGSRRYDSDALCWVDRGVCFVWVVWYVAELELVFCTIGVIRDSYTRCAKAVLEMTNGVSLGLTLDESRLFPIFQSPSFPIALWNTAFHACSKPCV